MCNLAINDLQVLDIWAITYRFVNLQTYHGANLYMTFNKLNISEKRLVAKSFEICYLGIDLFETFKRFGDLKKYHGSNLLRYILSNDHCEK